jgi:spore germination protein KA
VWARLRRLWRERHEEKTSSPEGVERLSPRLDRNVDRIKAEFGDSADLQVRRLRIGRDGCIHALLISIDGLIDKKYLTDAVVRPLTQCDIPAGCGSEIFQYLKEQMLAVTDISETHHMTRVFMALGGGDSVLLIQDVANALIFDTKGWEQRGIEEPITESTIRGSKEGFVENIRTNTGLLRRRIRSPRLRIEEHLLGRISQTRIALAYVDGLADEQILREIRSRLDRIDVDAIQGSGQLEEYITDAPYSPFPVWMPTERPDRAAGALLEGRIVILMDGTPFQLVAPATFTMFLDTAEDYCASYFIASLLRPLRFGAFAASLVLPSVYVAIVTFHQEMLPTPLILSIAAQREGVPLPTVFEALMMETIFEVMREAGVRLPRIVGTAISIIGALVLGEAAIRAEVVSPIMAVVVAATGIASFSVPIYTFGIAPRMLRFVFLFLAGSMGLFGVIAGLFALHIHLVSLRSLGMPYLEPLAPLVVSDLKDSLIRAPWWSIDTRPRLLGRKGGSRRQRPHLRPGEFPTERQEKDR